MAYVQIEQNINGVTWIKINREEIRNAVNFEVMKELDELLSIAEGDDSKVVILSGVGKKSFCSGGDLSVFQHIMNEEDARSMLMRMGAILERIAFFPKITIAALNGTAVGGGAELASACDLRIAASHIKVGFVQANLAITTGWGGGTLLLERMAKSEALQMLLSAQMYSAEELLRNGFIQKVITKGSFEDEVMDYAAPYLNKSQMVLQAYKGRFMDGLDQERIHMNMQKEIRECAKLWEAEEHHEAVRTFLQRSKNI
ncbi:enoyl-CoA hydratase/isomerase family protein [Halalkalibacter alkaliphilus]|uniref:Enoyl-CoA hydratase/isomerase family protein n=1 Tax=Halalkalibacter alkaliphilus TaxID=2917993 RepID=A0A9X2A3T3_9BACI|nr:enoyl-CoA hydratase/isomerase family protein [Halalkalibacter alkaliphilus]MCL7746357.1 enoyl-CoA hydratase/isomerase family protein [Halalkalibacter alkaliphilus]